ncbi:MAG: [acyl-carrier-protein] S-malonyltransferase [Alphaproteobacteria bacterium]|nr:[acyl-carrier-protein] S-malonyltransferase [Alphaproteobacteria bacterium]
MIRAFVFPGQGSQTVGMGRDLAAAFPAARQVFEEVDDALGQKLAKLMFEGLESDLTLTENAQPALMASSIAVVRVIEAEVGAPLARFGALAAGHSLGEYSALVAVGALSLAATARLLRRRGQAMQAAVGVGEGAMTALLGAEIDVAKTIAAEAAAGEVCDVANDNGPGQIVLSGSVHAIERAESIAAKHGVKRAIRLVVSAPFHCALMRPAADAMAEALATTTIATPALPIVANVTAQPETIPERLRTLLVQQVTGTVRWRESVLAMKSAGVDTIVELGTGNILSGLVRRIDRDFAAMSAALPADIEALMKTF